MIIQSLRPQMTVAMAATSIAVAIFIFISLTIYDLVATPIIIENLPADVKEYIQQDIEIPPNIEAALEKEWPFWPEILATLGFSLAGSGIGGLIGYRFASRLSKPIEILASSARALAGGDLSARAELKKGHVREIKKLAKDFNSMAAELQRAHREQAENASAIAHELRTPVTVLRGRLQGMADGVFELNAATLKGLIAQTETLNRIIEDLRTLTLSQSGRLDLSPVAIDLSEEVADVLAAVKPLVEKAGLTVTSELKPAMVFADPIRMRQAIGSLVENAKQYAREGGELTIETGTNHKVVFVRVMDRGPGLDSTAAVRVFDRFWRADESRSRKFGGFGLGLAVVKRICKDHGGDVVYTDREGGGAVFEITLPLKPKPQLDRSRLVSAADAADV